MAELSNVARATARMARRFLLGPEHRRFRYLVVLGLAIRLILAPISSWGIDTPFFTLSAVNLLYTGNPYRAYTFYNPPLGPLLQLPLFRLASQFQVPSTFVQFYPSLAYVSEQTQMIVPYMPTPTALLLLKLPLIFADLAAAFLLYLATQHLGTHRATWLASAWFLNPLVIWSASVHGEVDGIAAVFTIAFILALSRGWALPSGVFLGLGVFTKIYPLALLPVAAAWLVWAGKGASDRTSPWRAVGGLLGGVGLASIPFLPYLGGFSSILAHESGNTNFGGLSVLILFNAELSPIGGLLPQVAGHWIAVAFEVSLGIAVTGATMLIFVARKWLRTASDPERLAFLSLVTAWCVAAALIAILTAQAENIVALVPLLLLALPLTGRSGPWSIGILSGSAWLQYLSLLTPLGFFFPLAELLGPSAVASTSKIVVAYTSGNLGITQGMAWTSLGTIAGLTLLYLWAQGVRRCVRALRSPQEVG